MAKDIWKRINFDRAEEEPLPSGTIMLHYIFKDNYGNTFKWTPRWRDVEDIFVRSAQVEGTNAPEGVWDEELKRVLQRIPYRQHDIEIFQKADAIMSEKNLVGLLESLQAGHCYRDSQSSKLDEFLWFFDYESNRYVSKKLYDLAERLCDALHELGRFLWASDAFFDVPRGGPGNDQLFKLYPAYEIIERRGVDETEYHKQRSEYVDKLEKIVETTRQAYKDYRIHIRETLFQ